ncbi:MAG: tetratricopeptide repeat protein [Gemmatimonadetes bacterium]|nr:tetratricopeptide repeat protein [Gemmatimonadota bacterium]
MAEVFERLNAALAGRYRLERELGQGGMATVYLAQDLKHHRPVAVKVLRPELAATLGPERFLREIEIAAQLHHPHILPLYDSGEAGGFLFYVMPYEEGRSLREKLEREGELPVGDVVRLLRDVLDALAHAHAHGVVHRDIKPENILLSGHHALVTDFGVAKAVSEASGRQQLTTKGVALGTPAYMAPEQAAADPHVDHRADIYAAGIVAYELLTGRPPFEGMSAPQVLAAQVTAVPEPVTARRPTVSPVLAQLVMRCLEKKPADRPQSAAELVPQLEALLTPSGGMTPTEAVLMSSGTRAALQRHHPLRVLGLSAVGALAVLAAVYAAVRLIGLPAWVIAFTVAILALGVPSVVLPGRHARQRLVAGSTGRVQTLPGLQRHFTWRRTWRAAALAFGGLAVITIGYMAMRQLGIGPPGTLLAKGVLETRDRVVMADFANQTADSTLGRTIQELIRIDLDQSPVVTLLTSSEVRQALGRMRRAADTVLTQELAEELARREGAKAVLTGEVVPLGGGYVVSVRLLGAGTNQVLTARRETAAGSEELIAAVDRVSRGLRERIGESLRSVQGGQPLEQVTTASLDALRDYSEGTRAYEAGEFMRGLDLLRRAIHTDTTFAMAYRRLGAYLNNIGTPRRQVVAVISRAFELRERLPERERMLAEAAYHQYVTEDYDQAIEAYRTLLDRYPDNATAWNNMGSLLLSRRRPVEAESAFVRAARLGLSMSGLNRVDALIEQGKTAAAENVLSRWAEAHPGHPNIPFYRTQFADLRGDYDEVERITRATVPALRAGDVSTRMLAEYALEASAELQGHIRETQQQARALRAASRELGSERLPAPLGDALDAAEFAVWYGRSPAPALAALDTALARYPLDSIPAEQRGYPSMAWAFARAGNAARAREFMVRYDREATDAGPRTRAQELRFLRGQIALAEQRWPEAIAELRMWQDSADALDLIWVADAYDRAGHADSAVAVYERWLATPGTRLYWDPMWLPRTLRRLGELYEARGDRAKARDYYTRFAELWKDADLEYQPLVRAARAKAARLGGS